MTVILDSLITNSQIIAPKFLRQNRVLFACLGYKSFHSLVSRQPRAMRTSLEQVDPLLGHLVRPCSINFF